MFEQIGPFQVPSKNLKKNIDDELNQTMLRLKASEKKYEELRKINAIQKELLKVFPRGPKLKQAYEDYMSGKIDINGNKINQSKREKLKEPAKSNLKNPVMESHDDRVNVRLELMKVFPKGPKLDKAFRDYMNDKIDIKGNYLSEDIKEAEATKEQLEKIIPLSNYNLFDNNKLILSNSSLDDIKKKVKKDKLFIIEKPKKVYFIKATYDPKDESKVLTVMCRIYNITPDLEFEYIQKNDIIIYSKDELKKYGFTNEIIKKIFHYVDNDIDTKKITSNISDVLENKINQPKKESIEKTIKEMPAKKMTAKEAKEEKEREELAERAELKQLIYTLYMDGKISSELSSKLRSGIDAGKINKEQMAKEIMKEQKGESEEEPKRGRPSKKESSKKEKSLSPLRPKSPEPEKKKGRPKKKPSPEPSPERSPSPEPVKKKKIIKEAIPTPSKIVSTSKTLKDALKEPVRQLDLLNATIKAKLDSGDHIMIDTYLKLRKDLTAKEKKAIRASLERELEEKMKGTGLNHPMHQIYGYGINRAEEAHEYFQHVKNRFGKI